MGQDRTNYRLSQELRIELGKWEGHIKKIFQKGMTWQFKKLQGWLPLIEVGKMGRETALCGERVWFWICWGFVSKRTVWGSKKYQASGQEWDPVGHSRLWSWVLYIVHCHLYRVAGVRVNNVWVREGKSSRIDRFAHIWWGREYQRKRIQKKSLKNKT